MSWCLSVKLAKMPDVVQTHGGLPYNFVVGIDGFDSRQMQQRIKQHGRVPIGQYEAVAIGPDGISGIIAKDALPQRIRNRRQRHWRPRMAGVGLLNSIHGKSADCIDRELVDVTCVLDVLALFRNLRHCKRTSHFAWDSFGEIGDSRAALSSTNKPKPNCSFRLSF